MSGSYAGKVVAITGAGGGIGGAIASVMAAEGARVVLADRTAATLAPLAGRLGPDRCEVVQADVSRVGDNDRIIEAASRRFGGVDVFVANAAIGLPTCSIADLPVDSFDEVMAVNVRGVFLGMRAAIPALRARGGGSIVVVSSIAGVKGRGTGNAPYVTSKHAVVGLAKTAAIECAPHGIRVNCVLPGPTDTPMIRQLEAGRSADTGGDGRAEILRGMPMGRYGQPQEIARLVAFVASDDAGFCTGGVYAADGGLSAV